MKTLFIPVTYIETPEFLDIASHSLPKNLVIAYSIQFKESANKLKNILEKKHNILSFIQVLGCSNPKINAKTQAIILVSSGRFHAISLAYETKLPTYLLDNNKLSLISEKDIEIISKNKKAAYLSFLNSSKLGLIISTKPGQQALKKAINLNKEIKKKQSKKVYNFLTNNINVKEFENFNLNCWINTACPRMDFNLPILNLQDVNSLLRSKQ